jgi:hypothetical protein
MGRLNWQKANDHYRMRRYGSESVRDDPFVVDRWLAQVKARSQAGKANLQTQSPTKAELARHAAAAFMQWRERKKADRL